MTEEAHAGGHVSHGHAAGTGHYAHYAHQLHLVAEGVEFAGHKLHHWSGYAKEIRAAQKLARAHAQMAFGLRRMARGVATIERVAKQGGAVGTRAAAQLTKARAALAAPWCNKHNAPRGAQQGGVLQTRAGVDRLGRAPGSRGTLER
jgi:hypothetical protein